MKNRLTALALILASCGVGTAQDKPASEWRLALPGYRYQFPRDFFNHPDYQTEWWYYTGNLHDAQGRRFGYELTFFRQGIERDVTNPSAWAVRDLYLAHFALSDVSGKKFYNYDRLNRQGPGLAGIDASSGTVWNGDWQVKFDGESQTLRAMIEGVDLTLQLDPAKGPVEEGLDGVDQKSAGVGHASHYFSFSRLRSSGTLALNGKPYTLQGVSWMDHEFFTAVKGDTLAGWDWFSIQLDDNTELMLYRLRHADGSIEPYSSGTYIDPQGRTTHLTLSDFKLTPTGEQWTSPRTHATYPIAWQVSVPRLGLELRMTTPLSDQELASRGTIPTYWEGAADFNGTREGHAIHGVGYLEMTGYDRRLNLADNLNR